METTPYLHVHVMCMSRAMQLVVSTPARFNDILEHHPQEAELADVEVFVVDVDCLLSMGFEAQVRSTCDLWVWLPCGCGRCV